MPCGSTEYEEPTTQLSESLECACASSSTSDESESSDADSDSSCSHHSGEEDHLQVENKSSAILSIGDHCLQSSGELRIPASRSLNA